MLEKNGDQDRLKRPGSRGIDPGLHMKPCLFKEAIEKLLIFLSQSPPKLPPFLDFLLQNPTERENGPAHNFVLRHAPRRMHGSPEPCMVQGVSEM
jgi:hypothetical protein